jgi:hypothetical protein
MLLFFGQDRDNDGQPLWYETLRSLTALGWF